MNQEWRPARVHAGATKSSAHWPFNPQTNEPGISEILLRSLRRRNACTPMKYPPFTLQPEA